MRSAKSPSITHNSSLQTFDPLFPRPSSRTLKILASSQRIPVQTFRSALVLGFWSPTPPDGPNHTRRSSVPPGGCLGAPGHRSGADPDHRHGGRGHGESTTLALCLNQLSENRGSGSVRERHRHRERSFFTRMEHQWFHWATGEEFFGEKKDQFLIILPGPSL